MAMQENLSITDKMSITVTSQQSTGPRTIVAVCGRPGTGKTTLFRKYMEDKSWVAVEPAKFVSAMYNAERNLYILGKYEDGVTFAGTDRLGMSCQPNVQEWIASHNCNILFEGDRLTNGKFYDFLLDLENTNTSLYVINAVESTLTKRYASRGSDQSETFLKGRETKIGNILSNFTYMDHTTQWDNENFEQQKCILDALEAKFPIL